MSLSFNLPNNNQLTVTVPFRQSSSFMHAFSGQFLAFSTAAGRSDAAFVSADHFDDVLIFCHVLTVVQS